MRRGPLVLAGFLALLYWGTFGLLDDGMVLGNDAIPYAAELARGGGHTSPHHLLFHPLAALVKGLLAPLAHDELSLRGPLGLAMTSQVLVSALGGGLAAAAFLWSLGRLGLPRLWSWALTAVLALSAGHWLYAAVGETYLPAIAAQTALLGLALVARVEDGGAASGRRQALLVLLLLVATLLRQDSVLVVPALLILLTPRTASAVVGLAGLASLVCYLVAWLAAEPGQDFLPWLRGLADTGLWGGGFDAVRWKVSGTLGLAALAYPMYYAGQAGLHGEVGLDLVLGLAPWLLLCGALVASRLGTAPAEDRPHHRRAVLALAVLLVLRLAFFTWWQPGNLEFHTVHLAPALLLLAVLLRPPTIDRAAGPTTELAPRLLVLAAATTLIVNWTSLIAPNRTPAMHAVATEALDTVAPGGLVLSLDRLGHYANLRAAGTTARGLEPAPLILDASDVASGLDLAGAPDLRRAIDAAAARVSLDPAPPLARPPVVATRDRILPERFAHAPWPLDWSRAPGTEGQGDPGHEGGMNLLFEGRDARPKDETAGMDAAIWTLR